ncbi:methyltransferase domain-containing protein [Luteibacter aegosomatissinici]|uniref:methyltransferase domain-containing protein n=1 Tax=Luteibacter aegosomatissinici TaxID=2911539 RepID=UPI001FF78BA2|nr:class I SAM-dependent methyltransferase [Luteibacter aegosomatissinici]UPG95277.1 class I SAM-dependent methyltransferase [Luteibacter aegosomatissinici]
MRTASTAAPVTMHGMTDAPCAFLHLLETDTTWREPGAFRWRADAADQLDLLLVAMTDDTQRQRAESLLEAMSAADDALFRELRAAIIAGEGKAALAPWLDVGEPVGAHYDALDVLLAGVLAIDEPVLDDPRPPADMVFYQPTPARHIVDAVRRTALSPADHLLDLGSGLGHVPLLARILSGAAVSGLDREPAYVDSARNAATALGLPEVAFACGDARDADYSRANVFYLFTPFIGPVLRDVVARLEAEAQKRPVQIVALGPCTRTFARQPWLQTKDAHPEATDRVVLFTPR